jgi:hypothetical protein
MFSRYPLRLLMLTKAATPRANVKSTRVPVPRKSFLLIVRFATVVS